MENQDSHRIWVQLKRIADALERAYPPPPAIDADIVDDELKEPRRGVVL